LNYRDILFGGSRIVSSGRADERTGRQRKAGRQTNLTDGRTDVTQLIAAFRSFAKALKHSHKIRSKVAQVDLRVRMCENTVK